MFFMGLPIGGIVGFAIGVFGLTTFMSGWTDFRDSFEKMGVDYEELSSSGDSAIVFTWMANILVILYGFRERYRIRCAECMPHKAGNCAWLIKFILKSFITLAAVLSFILNLYFALFISGIVVNLFVAKSMCEIDQGTALIVLEVLPGGTSSNGNKVCAEVSKLIGFDSFKDAGDFLDSPVMLCIQGALVLVVSQAIMFAYWMKYSTLGNVKAWWSGGAGLEEGENYL